MLIKDAETICGKLSKTSKMPCRSFNTSAEDCNRGSKLRGMENSVCSSCYACKGNYVYPNVADAIKSRLEKCYDPRWMLGMVTLINKQSPDYFRWFDSGDIHSLKQLRLITSVVIGTPNTKHWLPTREFDFLTRYYGELIPVPSNLCIRLSSDFIDMPARSIGFPTSEVTTDPSKVTCPAYSQGGQCLTCRLCWDKDIPLVTYPKH